MCRVSENALAILVSRRLLPCSKLVNYLGLPKDLFRRFFWKRDFLAYEALDRTLGAAEPSRAVNVNSINWKFGSLLHRELDGYLPLVGSPLVWFS